MCSSKKSFSSIYSGLRNNSAGAVFIECILSLSVLVLIAGGIIDYIFILRDKQMMVRAASIGGRIAAMQPPGTLNIQNTVCRGVEAFIFQSRRGPADFQIDISFTDPPYLEVEVSRPSSKFIGLPLTGGFSSKSVIKLSDGSTITALVKGIGQTCPL